MACPIGAKYALVGLMVVPNVISITALAADQRAELPEEYLATGESSLALGNGGAVVSSGVSAVRANPGMLAAERDYSVSGTYHWPRAGREFYQLGVVDSKTSSVAAGVSYTSALDQYEGAVAGDGNFHTADTPVKRRVAVALAQNLKNVSIGAGGSYVEASRPEVTFSSSDDRIKGYTLNGGFVWTISPGARVGLSIENLANRKVAFAAPTIIRGGAAIGVTKELSMHLDYRHREAVEAFDAPAPSLGIVEVPSNDAKKLSAEQNVTVSAAAKIYDLVRVMAATGMSDTGGRKTTLIAGGIALVNQKFSVAYGAQKNDISASGVHHGLSLSTAISL